MLLHGARKEKAVCGLASCVALEAHSHGHHNHDVVDRRATQMMQRHDEVHSYDGVEKRGRR